jgi:hypothetical protein
MSALAEKPEVNFEADPKAKKAAKPKKARKPPRRASFQKPSAPFPGLTRTACADACGKAGCAISGKPYCAHPTKGGLQSVDLNNPDALKRQNAARGQLDVRLDPDRFK